MKQSKFPKGWDESKLQTVLSHYEGQSEDDAVNEDETVLNDQSQTLMEVPKGLVAVVRELIARHDTKHLQHA
ncbi:hypothetical protein JZU51_00350 [bacterium]|nr:hypothetical protein [bacterium]